MLRSVLRKNFSSLRDQYISIVKDKKMHSDERQLAVVQLFVVRSINSKDLRVNLRVPIRGGEVLLILASLRKKNLRKLRRKERRGRKEGHCFRDCSKDSFQQFLHLPMSKACTSLAAVAAAKVFFRICFTQV